LVPSSPEVIVEIDRLSLEGDGLATHGGREIRVPQVIPGERVVVRPRAAADGTLEGEVVRLLSPSPHRVAPRCRHFGPCGGCAWQHVGYAEQLRLKQVQLQSLIDEALGPRAPRVSATVPSPASPAGSTPWGYRNKVSFTFAPGDRGQGLVMGHYRRGSRRVLPVVECPVHDEAGNQIAFALHAALRQGGIPGVTADAGAGVARHVVVRTAASRGEWLATLVVTENVKELRRVTPRFLAAVAGGPPGGFHLNVHDRDDPFLFGRETRRLHGLTEIREQVGGVTFLIAPTAFFQTNVRVAEEMVRHVLGALPAPRFPRVLDLYSGVGLFALALAASGSTVMAVEENGGAVAAAETARRVNRLPAARLALVGGRVEDTLARVTPRSPAERHDAVVLDPPRQGCPPPVLDWILRRHQPRRVVYVSCNPAALANDLRTAVAAGYRVHAVVPFDMFPHTAHIESIATLDGATA
jgi:23S rRNA (uracil1939-C5)-methyltransferase